MFFLKSNKKDGRLSTYPTVDIKLKQVFVLAAGTVPRTFSVGTTLSFAKCKTSHQKLAAAFLNGIWATEFLSFILNIKQKMPTPPPLSTPQMTK